MSRITRLAAVTLLAGVTLLGGGAAASADSGALGTASGSPGVLSGNVVQIPIDIPLNVCGNSIGVISLLNPTLANLCATT